jgi:hypothetical protein
MDRPEWDQIVALIAANWPNNPPPDLTIDKAYMDLQDLPAEQVLAAVETFNRDGESFPPNGGKIRQRVVELQFDAPSWGEIWKHLRRAQMKAPAFREDRDERRPYLEAQGLTLAADFMEAIGWPTPDEWGDDNLESRVRNKWKEWLRDYLGGETYRGIPAGGLARLERGTAPRKIGDAIGAVRKQLTPGD